ncbi:response regulator [Nitrospira sp. M1]
MIFRTRQILIIDDDADDILILEECLSRTSLDFQVTALHTGSEAIPYLHEFSREKTKGRPDLIILDLHLPDIDGVELIRAIRRNIVLCVIPIIVYSGSDDQERIRKCYAAGVNCCLKKPSNIDEAMTLASAIHEFWFTTLQLPSNYA